MNAIETGIPDLLQRFVPTPHTAVVALSGAKIVIQSNDKELIASLEGAGTPPENLNTSSLNARVVRDHAAPTGGSDITVISNWPLATIIFGAGTVLAVDSERCELLGFIAMSVSAEQFIGSLLPIVVNLANRRSSTNAAV
jgi:hypothetical protein